MYTNYDDVAIIPEKKSFLSNGLFRFLFITAALIVLFFYGGGTDKIMSMTPKPASTPSPSPSILIIGEMPGRMPREESISRQTLVDEDGIFIEVLSYTKEPIYVDLSS